MTREIRSVLSLPVYHDVVQDLPVSKLPEHEWKGNKRHNSQGRQEGLDHVSIEAGRFLEIVAQQNLVEHEFSYSCSQSDYVEGRHHRSVHQSQSYEYHHMR